MGDESSQVEGAELSIQLLVAYSSMHSTDRVEMDSLSPSGNLIPDSADTISGCCTPETCGYNHGSRFHHYHGKQAGAYEDFILCSAVLD